jgi:MFS transporter, DHA1 family, inner membrane transport protein
VVFLWGVASFALVPPLQVRVMTAAADAPNLASSVNIGAFNLGNALGAALGGGVIALDLGYPAVALAGAATSAMGLVAVLLAARGFRGQDQRQLLAHPRL